MESRLVPWQLLFQWAPGIVSSPAPPVACQRQFGDKLYDVKHDMFYIISVYTMSGKEI